MASLLSNLVFAGSHTLLSTQASLGSIAAAANLYSINTGNVQSQLDCALFQPAFLAQTPGSSQGAGIGFGGCTLAPLLFTRSGGTCVWYNPNTTAVPGDIWAPYVHSRAR